MLKSEDLKMDFLAEIKSLHHSCDIVAVLISDCIAVWDCLENRVACWRSSNLELCTEVRF